MEQSPPGDNAPTNPSKKSGFRQNVGGKNVKRGNRRFVVSGRCNEFWEYSGGGIRSAASQKVWVMALEGVPLGKGNPGGEGLQCGPGYKLYATGKSLLAGIGEKGTLGEGAAELKRESGLIKEPGTVRGGERGRDGGPGACPKSGRGTRTSLGAEQLQKEK